MKPARRTTTWALIRERYPYRCNVDVDRRHGPLIEPISSVSSLTHALSTGAGI
jgi:hypothetical protein